MSNYWTQEDLTRMDSAVTYRDLYAIAVVVLERMPRPRVQMCGPISTGGAGSVEENLKRFEAAIEKLSDSGIVVFDQLPFEMPIRKIRQLKNKKGYDTDLLEDFYLPIFESKLVNTLYFLPDWQSSTGATWEHEQARRFDFDVVYLD